MFISDSDYLTRKKRGKKREGKKNFFVIQISYQDFVSTKISNFSIGFFFLSISFSVFKNKNKDKHKDIFFFFLFILKQTYSIQYNTHWKKKKRGSFLMQGPLTHKYMNLDSYRRRNKYIRRILMIFPI